MNGGETDQAMMNARHFYIGQWYRDANVIGKATKGKYLAKVMDSSGIWVVTDRVPETAWPGFGSAVKKWV